MRFPRGWVGGAVRFSVSELGYITYLDHFTEPAFTQSLQFLELDTVAAA